MFPDAKLDDGLLNLCVFPRVNWPLILRYTVTYLLGHLAPPKTARMLRVPAAKLSSSGPVMFEVEGELCGTLPVELGLAPGVLRVVVPR